MRKLLIVLYLAMDQFQTFVVSAFNAVFDHYRQFRLCFSLPDKYSIDAYAYEGAKMWPIFSAKPLLIT